MNASNESRPNARKVAEFTGHRQSIYALTSMNSGSGIYSAGGDGLIVGWSAHNPESAGTVAARVSGSVYSMCSLPGRNLLLTGENQFGIHQVDLATSSSKPIPLGAVIIFDIVADKNENLIHAGTSTGELICINSHALVVQNRIRISDKSIRTLAVHPDGHELAVGSSDHRIRIYQIVDDMWTPIHDWIAHENSVFTLAYSPDGNNLLSAGRDATVKQWDTRNGYVSTGSVNAHLHAIHQVAYSPDGKHFLTCSMDKTIKIWSSDDLRLLRVLDRSRHGGHTSSVNRLIWLDDQLFASAGDDRRVILWQLYETINPS